MLKPSPEITEILNARRTRFPTDDAPCAATSTPPSGGTPNTPTHQTPDAETPTLLEIHQLSSLDIDLLNAFLDGIEHLSEAHFGRKVRLTEIAAWIQNPNVRTILNFLKELHTLRSEHLILNARNTALARLAKIAHADPGNAAESERARKAASTILRYSTPTTAPARTPPSEHENSSPGPKRSSTVKRPGNRDQPASVPPRPQRAANEVTGTSSVAAHHAPSRSAESPSQMGATAGDGPTLASDDSTPPNLASRSKPTLNGETENPHDPAATGPIPGAPFHPTSAIPHPTSPNPPDPKPP